MKKFGFILIIILFAVVIATPWALSIAGVSISIGDTSGEIRTLAKFPEEFSNDFFIKINDYFDDHSPLRSTIIGLENVIDDKLEKAYETLILDPIAKSEEDKYLEGTDTPASSGETAVPTATPDFSDIFGEVTKAPETEVPTSTPTFTTEPTDTPAPTDTPKPGETAAPTEEPTDTPSPTPTGTPTPTPTATPVPTPTPCQHDYKVIRSQTASVEHDGYTLKKCSICGEVTISDIVYRNSLEKFSQRRALKVDGVGYKGLYDWYFYAGDDSLSYYRGDNVLSEDEMADWKYELERLNNLCKEKGVNLVYLILPNKEQVYSEYLPTSGMGDVADYTEKRAWVFAEYLNKNSSVNFFYPLKQLKTAKILYETYLKQDTHWNDVGGFVAAQLIYGAIGKTVTGIQNVDISTYTTSSGDLVSLGVGSASTYDGYEVNYKPEVEVLETYMYSNTTVGGNSTPNSELRYLVTNADSDQTCVVVGDSYRHSLVRTLQKDYKYVYVGHRGDFGTTSTYVQNPDGSQKSYNKRLLHEGIKSLKSGDLLVVLAVERYDSQLITSAADISTYIELLKSQGKW